MRLTGARQTVPVLLSDLVETSAAVAATRSRLAKTELLQALLRRAPGDDLGTAIGLLTASPRQGRTGVGWSTLSGVTDALADVGHGTVPATGEPLTVADVDTALDGLAAASTATERRAVLSTLLVRASTQERWFLSGVLLGEVRQGALDAALAEAAAVAFEVPSDAVRRAWMLTGSLAHAAALARAEGVDGLAAVGLQVLRPVRPMLAASAKSVSEALSDKAFAGADEVYVDEKLDGAHIQVHRDGDEVRVFTRSLKEVTHRLPEVVEAVRALPAHRLVLDGESMVLADDGRPRAFADTMSRFGADAPREAVVRPYFFDLLHVDGRDLLDEPLRTRLDELERVAGGYRVRWITTSDPAEAEAFALAAGDAGQEGVMVKALSAPYAAGRRGSAWQKVKPVRTLDLVVLAAEWGHGRRQGWLSNLHLGARDPDGGYGEPGGFVMVGKTFKGMTDEVLRWQTEALQELEVRRTAGTVWVRPKRVVEIALDGAQRSPRYPGGAALRFARVVRYRDDKTPDEADTIGAVRELLPPGQA